MDVRGNTAAAAVPGQFIVGFKPGTTPEQRAATVRSLAPQNVEPLDFVNAALVEVGKSSSLINGASGKLPEHVAWVQPNYVQHLRGEVASAPAPKPSPTPAPPSAPAPAPAPGPVNDPQFANQYHLRNTGQTGGTAGADVKAVQAWAKSQGKDVVVAIADTNVDINHADLKANIWVNKGEIAGNNKDDDNNGYVDDVNGWNFGMNKADVTAGGQSHGTHVAGIIAAQTNNGVGTAGVAPGVKVMPLAILTSSSTTANAIKAFAYAAKNGANIINNSWGNNNYEPALQAAVTQATKAGLLVVVASGNENWDTGVHGSYPDNYAGSVSVAASDHKDAKASYSNRGVLTIDIAAPGDKVLSSVPGNNYGNKSGTSMAAPIYAATAALVKSAYPQLTMPQVADRIFRSQQRDGSAAQWKDLVAGGGRLDAAAALMPIATPVAPRPIGNNVQKVVADTPATADTFNQGVAPAIVLSGAPVKLTWGTDIATGHSYEVQASLNPNDTAAVNEDFENGATRAFRTAGDKQWAVAAGTAKVGSKSFQVNGLGGDKQSRLELTEVLTEPAEISFWYKGSKQGELSFFVNRDLQFQPTPSNNEDWKEFKATLPAGEHTLSWLATGRGGSGTPFAIDGLKISKVSAAKWQPVGKVANDGTSIDWTPAATSAAAQVRVRADNGRFASDWVSGPAFEVR